MLSEDQAVLRQAHRWCREGQTAWLCTIVTVTGSSPRPRGAMLALNVAGDVVGSLSGGCVEEDLLQALLQGEIEINAPRLLEYGVNAEENARLGLPCGGRLGVLVQKLDRADTDWLDAALLAIDARYCLLRKLDLDSGETQVTRVDSYTEPALDERTLRQCFGPQMRMLLVGAGQLAQTLAELAQAMDYQVIVTDPRAETLQRWRGPDIELVQGMPDDVVLARADDPFAIVITLTHDPRIDDMALMVALETRAWYVGALGSQRTTEKRLQRLRALEVSEVAIARLHAPVGLAIGSKTPLEIAVAIMAEITSLRRGARGATAG
ncbi:XdhC family protein [Pseudohalioglobus sediminis]|uniref:XdhC family protein n=1 Tax=Pseudohalioglobus sediminis TaxID=2606449 RepID=A0A5B0WNU6_9GAMM|nr:XdhC family protein [Pseudohalioglobus sediminis]KAA1188108.1 XdhC family protein [Pseudohalioglobus sediminis]